MKRHLRLTRAARHRLVEKINASRSRIGWRTRISYALGGAAHSLLAKLQQAAFRERLETAISPAPVFLLGFWRSGTTFLHELFSCDHRFGFPSTYACLNPAHFLLTEAWIQERAGRQIRRPMDNMLYSWTSPQEDEFALVVMGAPSPYEALFVPSLMFNPRWLLDLRARGQTAQDHWTQALLQFLRMLTIQQGKAMLLKSPSHGFKLPVLPSIFPQARYVIIDRNPYEVFASNLNLWCTLLEMYSWESYTPEDVEAFVIAAYLIHEEAIAEGTSLISAPSVARVSYEALIADPIAQMKRLYLELEIEDFNTVQPKMQEYVARVGEHKRNHFLLSPAQKSHVDATWGNAIRRKGYAWPQDYVRLASSCSSN
jgi:omega-hydroxy-beta-dihydromenaquinone-9 sulfotransferase